MATLVACGDEEPKDNPLVCTSPTAPACEDALILDLILQRDPAPGLITNTADGNGWRSEIDATAGGADVPNPDSYVYARFLDDGLTKIDIGDEDALGVMLWDIAFRRFVVRLNGGDSGPGCTTAARTATGTTFDAVTDVSTDLVFRPDDYFTDAPACEFVNDGSGRPGAVPTVLAGFWSYPGCVQMTHVVYVLELRDGRHVKLEITQYYNDTAHQICQNDPDSFEPMSGTGAAHVRVRWAFLD